MRGNATDLLSSKDRENWVGYRCYKTYTDAEGQAFEGGCPKYVLFEGSLLIGEYASQTEAELAFKRGAPTKDIRLCDYKGIDGRVK